LNYLGLNSLDPQIRSGNLIKLPEGDTSCIKDLRDCWANPRLTSLNQDYHSIRNLFSHFKSDFLAKKLHNDHNELDKYLFPKELSPSVISFSNSKGKIIMIRILSTSDYLLSILWLIALEPFNSPCIKEYLAYLTRLMHLFGLQKVLKSALFLFRLENLERSHVMIQYDWILRLINESGSQILKIKGKEALNLEQLTLDNMKFLNLKGLLLSVLKVFGGLDNILFEEANKAFYNEMVKWRLGITLKPKELSLRKNIGLATIAQQMPEVSPGHSQLMLFFLKKICFELEEMSQREMVLKEHIKIKYYNQKINREEEKIRDQARGVLRFLFLGSSKGARVAENLEIKIQSYLGNMIGDVRILNSHHKSPLDYQYRLNIGLVELKSFLGKVVHLKTLVKGLREKWIAQKSLTLTKQMKETLNTHSPNSQDRVNTFLEAFANEKNFSGLERIEVICKMLVNLLIIDSISPKFMSRLITDLDSTFLGDFLLSTQKDQFFKRLCFKLGSKFFFDKETIYKYFFDSDVRLCLQNCEVTLLELKRQKGRTPRIRFDEREMSMTRSRSRDIKATREYGSNMNRQMINSDDLNFNRKSIDQMLKQNQSEIKGVINKIDVENILELGKIFLNRGKVNEGLQFVDILCHKFGCAEEEEKGVRKVTNEKLEQLRLTKDQEKIDHVTQISTRKLEHLYQQKEDLKLYLVGLILTIQDRKSKMLELDELKRSTWKSLVHWVKSSFNQLLSNHQNKSKTYTLMEKFLEGLSKAELQEFWEGVLRTILNQSNEEIRVIMLRSILCLEKPTTLKKMESFLRKEDLMRLVDEEMNFKGKIGIQNYFFLIDFFDNKKDYQVAIKLILNICCNNYYEKTVNSAFKISEEEVKKWMNYVKSNDQILDNEIENELKELYNEKGINLTQRHSLLGKARIMVKKLSAKENKNHLVKRVKTTMNLLDLQKEILSEITDYKTKIEKIKSFKRYFSLNNELIQKCFNMLDLVTFKLNYGQHSTEILVEHVIRSFHLFGSFDFYIKNFSVSENFFYENFFKNLHLGMEHFSKADSVLNCFALNNFLPEFPESINLIQEPLDSSKIQNCLINNKTKLLGQLARSNLIFPYNVFPSLLNSVTNFMLMTSKDLSNLQFLANKKNIFDYDLKLYNEDQLLNTDHSSKKDRQSLKETLQIEHVHMICQIQDANTRNSLLSDLMESRSLDIIKQEGVHSEPLWFIEHIMSNLKDKSQIYNIFKYCYIAWHQMKTQNEEPNRENEMLNHLNEAHQEKQFCRIQAVCMTLIDFMLKTQKKYIQDLAVSLQEDEKIQIRKNLKSFNKLQNKIKEILIRIVNGEEQITLLTYSNEKYIIWAQSLHEGLNKYNLSVQRRGIYS
jgi:hypothetical protein